MFRRLRLPELNSTVPYYYYYYYYRKKKTQGIRKETTWTRINHNYAHILLLFRGRHDVKRLSSNTA